MSFSLRKNGWGAVVMMSEEQLKGEKNRSLTVEREALESLENFYAAMSTSERRFDPDHLLILVQNMSSAIQVHRNSSEKYILHLEEKLKILERRLQGSR